jgi:hypothetical protein
MGRRRQQGGDLSGAGRAAKSARRTARSGPTRAADAGEACGGEWRRALWAPAGTLHAGASTPRTLPASWCSSPPTWRTSSPHKARSATSARTPGHGTRRSTPRSCPPAGALSGRGARASACAFPADAHPRAPPSPRRASAPRPAPAGALAGVRSGVRAGRTGVAAAAAKPRAGVRGAPRSSKRTALTSTVGACSGEASPRGLGAPGVPGPQPGLEAGRSRRGPSAEGVAALSRLVCAGEPAGAGPGVGRRGVRAAVRRLRRAATNPIRPAAAALCSGAKTLGSCCRHCSMHTLHSLANTCFSRAQPSPVCAPATHSHRCHPPAAKGGSACPERISFPGQGLDLVPCAALLGGRVLEHADERLGVMQQKRQRIPTGLR